MNDDLRWRGQIHHDPVHPDLPARVRPMIYTALSRVRYLYPDGEPLVTFEPDDHGPIAFVPTRMVRDWLDKEEPDRDARPPKDHDFYMSILGREDMPLSRNLPAVRLCVEREEFTIYVGGQKLCAAPTRHFLAWVRGERE